ncbi:hypothetical protein ACYX34_14975 [Nitrospira sp. CMX1]|nr:hypothetical protein [Nitrospira sp.]MBS0167730.1 hypothetical protein [Nitrospira sp.]
MATLALGRTFARTSHGRMRARFVDEHQLVHIKRGLGFLPLGPFLFHVFSFLLAGAQRFFKRQVSFIKLMSQRGRFDRHAVLGQPLA